jgi:hypothetical protein
LEIDLGARYYIGGLRYLPQQRSPVTPALQAATGVIERYSLYLSSDGINWGTPVAQGSLPPDRTTKFIVLPEMRGTLLYEWWLEMGGSRVDDLVSNPRYPYQPSERSLLTSLEAPANWADRYGARLRGYLYAPVTGQYRFWVAGDDTAQLYLSPDATPFKARMIAYTPASTFARQWDRYPEQQSGLVTLQANQPYYIEVIQKEASDGDNLAVAWQVPGGAPAIISGEYLAPLPLSAVVDVALGKTIIHSDFGNDLGSEARTAGQARISQMQADPAAKPLTSIDFTTGEWWQVDLEASYTIDSIQIWNGAACCAGVANLTIFISNRDLSERTLPDLLSDRTIARYQLDREASSKVVIPAGVAGRYVRVQVTGKNSFVPGRIEVWAMTNDQ